VDEDFVDLSGETRANLEAIAATPSSALGSTRDKPAIEPRFEGRGTLPRLGAVAPPPLVISIKSLFKNNRAPEWPAAELPKKQFVAGCSRLSSEQRGYRSHSLRDEIHRQGERYSSLTRIAGRIPACIGRGRCSLGSSAGHRRNWQALAMTRRGSPPRQHKLRCAIYTRKSSEEGLEQEFNSLHAQREACEAFIRAAF
jgi:hypothetical protein